MQKFASQGSVTSLASRGYLPPGHGYVPRKQKPEKAYGLEFRTRMNRTHRGPGEKYLRYAIVCAGFAFLFFLGAGLYFGHRNVSRMIVLRTEVLGVLMIIVGLVLIYMMGQFIFKARVESNRWRSFIRFRPEGLNTACATNTEYFPETKTEKLLSGTYGSKALREIPKPKLMKKKKRKGVDGSKASLLASPSESQTYLYPPQSPGVYAPYSPNDAGFPPKQSYVPKVQGYTPPNQTSSPASTLQPRYKAPHLPRDGQQFHEQASGGTQQKIQQYQIPSSQRYEMPAEYLQHGTAPFYRVENTTDESAL